VTFEEFVAELAAHPEDRGRQAVFSDWLLERGDSRGEALALELSGQSTAPLRKKHEKSWLGALAEYVDPQRCAFYGGFPVRLAFKRGAPPQAFEKLPRTLRHLAADWRALATVPKGLRLDSLEVLIGLGMAFSDFRALAGELDAVAPIEAPRLQLVLDTFIGAEAADFVAEGFLRSALAKRDDVTLLVREGSLDAASSWLHWARMWGGGERWAARWGGAEVAVTRNERGYFTVLQVDLSFDDDKAIAARCASAAAVLSQMRRLDPSRLEVLIPEGQRFSKRLRDTLNAPRRFLPGVGKVHLARKKS
jgi:uncharacterized protein (TIGR02996 family)